MAKYQTAVALALSLCLLGCAKAQTGATQTQTGLATSKTLPTASIAMDGRVTDAAHVFSPAFRTKLSAKLEQFERATQHRMVVVTVSSLGGRDVADFSRDLFNAWGIGRKGYNDGVGILIAPNERKIRIEVGLGLEETLTDPICQEIIDTAMLPSLRSGDFERGVDLGADRLIARLN